MLRAIQKLSLFALSTLFSTVSFATSLDQIHGIMSMQHQKVSDYAERYDQHYKSSRKEKGASKALKKAVTGNVKGSALAQVTVSITGNKSISSVDLKAQISKYLRKGVSQGEARQIRDVVENYYRNQGYLLPIAHVAVDAKSVVIKVIEGEIRDTILFLDSVKHDKNALQNKNLLKLAQDIEDSKPLRERDLERYMLLINKIHGYEAEYELLPLKVPEGDEVADMIIKIRRSKGKADVSLDNNGLKEVGKYQFLTNAQWYNVLSNDSLTLNAGLSDKYRRFKMFGGGYLKRLTPYGTSISASVSHSTDDPYSSPGSSDSQSTSIKGRFDQYLIINNDYSVKLELGVDQRNVIYYTGNLKARDYKYPMGFIGGKVKIVDPFNCENWFYPYYNWTLKSVSYSASSRSDINFKKRFGYFVVDWFRTQFLTDNFSFMLRASYQSTRDSLPSEHLYGIGSHHTIKGYKVGLVSSDQGVTGAAELRYSHHLKQNKLLDSVQLFGFYGYTKFIDRNKTSDPKKQSHPGLPYFNKSVLQSTGGGLRFYFPHGFYGEYTAAQPLTKEIKVDSSSIKTKFMHTFVINKEFNW